MQCRRWLPATCLVSFVLHILQHRGEPGTASLVPQRHLQPWDSGMIGLNHHSILGCLRPVASCPLQVVKRMQALRRGHERCQRSFPAWSNKQNCTGNHQHNVCIQGHVGSVVGVDFQIDLCANFTVVLADRLKRLYRRAMQLEVNFFSAQPNGPTPRKQTHVQQQQQ